jgi:hypothetical protein
MEVPFMIKLISKAFRSLELKGVMQYPYPGINFQTSRTLSEVPSLRPQPTWLEDQINGGFKVKLRKGLKRMTLLRFLVAKLLYGIDGLDLGEYLTLFHLYFELSENKDPGFQKKYGFWFNQKEPFFKDLGQATEFPVILNLGKDKEKLISFFGPIIPDYRGYCALSGERLLRNSFKILLNNSLFPQKIRPKNFIGVGYRDKGTRRDPATNGSPSWQETAKHFYELDRRAEEELMYQDHLGPPDMSDEG